MKSVIGKLHQVLCWLPPIVLLFPGVLLWRLAASGGGQGVLAWLLLQAGLPYLGGVVLVGTLGYAMWTRRFSFPAIFAVLLALLTIWPYFWRFGLLAVAYPVSIDQMTPSVTVRLPADVPLRVAWGGDSVRTNYHVTYPNLRWAYDLVVEPAGSGSDRLEDYGCWRVAVVAPAAGRVVVAHDGEPDEVPGQDSEDYTVPAGNHVFIRLSTGTYLAIGHLQQHSIVVREGEWVEEGRLIGKCGNSGSTSEPHIHIHHQRQDPSEIPYDLAEGLPLYFRDHDGPPMPEGGFRRENGLVVPTGPVVQHIGN